MIMPHQDTRLYLGDVILDMDTRWECVTGAGERDTEGKYGIWMLDQDKVWRYGNVGQELLLSRMVGAAGIWHMSRP